MTIPLKREAGGDLELFTAANVLDIDVVEPRSGGHIIVGATLGASDEVRLGVTTRTTRVMGEFAVDGNFDMTLGNITNIGEMEVNAQVWHVPVINNTATGAVTIALASNNAFRLGLTGTITGLTVTGGAPNNGWSAWLRLKILGASPPYTISWFAAKWVNDVEPPISTLLQNESIMVQMVRESGDYIFSWSGPYPA